MTPDRCKALHTAASAEPPIYIIVRRGRELE